MSAAGVLVLGALHLDIVVDAPRLPARDETVIGDRVGYSPGGKDGNQAVAASLHGASAAMAGRVGDDGFGAMLLAHLARAGVDASAVETVPGAASGISVAIVDAAGDYAAAVVSSVNRGVTAEALTIPEGTDVLLLQNEIPEAANLEAAARARRAGARVVLNAAPMRAMNPALIGLVDLLVLNRVEAAAFFGAEAEDAPAAAALLAARSGGPAEIVVTLGAAGAVLHRLGEAPEAVPAHPVRAVSSHGAGDVFTGALAARLAAGEGTGAACRYAAAAAALHVATPPADRLGVDEARVRAFLDGAGGGDG